LHLAKEQANGALTMNIVEINKKAQRFYSAHGSTFSDGNSENEEGLPGLENDLMSKLTNRKSSKGASNLILTGLMGTGKTTLGQLVASKLNRKFIDTDQYIEEQYGPVANIFNQPDGDDKFRLIEGKVANELSEKDNLVISTGGRFLLNQNNIDMMLKNGHIFCLVAELQDIVDRLTSSTGETYRPRFEKAANKLALMKQLEKQSESYFNQFEKIQTSGVGLSCLTSEIVNLFSKYHDD
jgi:shikimate kinase